MKFSCLLACAMGLVPTLGHASAADNWEGAPPPFTVQDSLIVPIDISNIDIDYHFDASTNKATAKARMVFASRQNGLPMFDLVPKVTELRLNGSILPASTLLTVETPSKATKVRVLNQPVAAGSENVLEIDYSLNDVTFTNGKVRSGFFMVDTSAGGRQFFEQYGPANFEFDQIKWHMKVTVSGTQIPHEIFTNGDISSLGSNQWEVDFPEYFTSSSLYFHVTDKNRFAVQRFIFEGKSAQIPVTVYAASTSLVSNAVTRTRSVMSELENTYGPFAHDKLVIYVTSSGGGMEYCGATMTSLGALGHELTHSWFARGVMPAQGNSGWIDEAVASWRDNGYPRASGLPNRAAVNLGGASPYSRHTPMAAYTSGAKLLSEFDFIARNQGGLRPVLKSLFGEKQRQTITVDFFKKYLEGALQEDLTNIFKRYVYGQSNIDGFRVFAPSLSNVEKTHHPRKYTTEELRFYQ